MASAAADYQGRPRPAKRLLGVMALKLLAEIIKAMAVKAMAWQGPLDRERRRRSSRTCCWQQPVARSELGLPPALAPAGANQGGKHQLTSFQ